MIAYYGRVNEKSDQTELHIKKALEELGHEVQMITLGEEIPECEFVLFHKVLPETNQKKVCWFFDKVGFSKEREDLVRKIIKNSDLVFLTDGTWAEANPNPKIRVLRQGAGWVNLGKTLAVGAKIAFTGSLYKNRYEWATRLSTRYGEGFQVFTGSFNQDLNNLCASVPVLVAPEEPSDDNYWSSRVYLTLGAGGFLIHPYCKELRKEYSENELVMYESEEDLFKKIDYYLEHSNERENIRLAGWKKTKENFTYQHRVKTLCQELHLTK